MSFIKYYSRASVISPEVLSPTDSAIWSLWNSDSDMIAKIYKIILFNPVHSSITNIASIQKLHVINFGRVTQILSGSRTTLMPVIRSDIKNPSEFYVRASSNGVLYGDILRQILFDFDESGTGMRSVVTIPKFMILWDCTEEVTDPLIIRQNEGCAVWLDVDTPFHTSYGTFTRPNAGFIDVYVELEIGIE